MGDHIERDLGQALKWYKKSAESGLARAQSSLGEMYEFGAGTKKDFKEAINWYPKAAEQNDYKAMYRLARMYEKGIGY